MGKTLVSSSMIDRVVSKLGRRLAEVPVGFKYFAPGLLDGSFCFGGEESAGASFLRQDGTVWTTDKDGILMDLLAAEITARTGKDPGEHFQALAAEFGTPYYTRIDAPATPEQKARLEKLSPEAVKASDLAGEPITAKLTRAPGNNEPIGGLKVVTANGWFAARPSGTENLYKVYAESFRDEKHLETIVARRRASSVTRWMARASRRSREESPAGNPSTEIRDPKETRNSKSEEGVNQGVGVQLQRQCLRASVFGFPSDLGFRSSDFAPRPRGASLPTSL